ncbi:MAG: LLM class F420-dependent oxidoreductase [Nitriliruptorales bacterium]
MRVGIGLSEDLPLSIQAQLAQEVEEAGFASMWTNEARGRDALLVCQGWSGHTRSVLIGTGVVPVWTRSPAQLAMGAATLQEASGGRLVLGLGVSHAATMRPWHGADWRKPLSAARETLEVLRSLFAGERSDHQGEVFTTRRFSLELTPRPPAPRLYLAAMGPKMLRLAGRQADGVLLNWTSPDAVREAVGAVRGAAADSDLGREPAEVVVAGYVRVAVGEDREAARLALAQEVASYCALPAYAAHFERQGFGKAVEAAKSAYHDGGSKAAAEAVPEEMLLEMGWYGTPGDNPASSLDRYADAGLDHLVARVVVVGGDVVESLHGVVSSLRTSIV